MIAADAKFGTSLEQDLEQRVGRAVLILMDVKIRLVAGH